MKIAIITIHKIHNFGSVFQAQGLYKYLSNKGYDVEVIDYNPEYFRKKKLKSKIGELIYYPYYKARKEKFKKFVERNMNLSKKEYLSVSDLKKDTPEADVYISGGDQLWNSYHPCGNDDAYKLSFTNGLKISYSTSMGRNTYTNSELVALRDELKDYYSISVRESSSVKLLKSVGVENITQVVDPVLLLDNSDYEKMLVKPEIERYLFVYLVTPSKLLSETVKYISEKLGLKIVLYGGFSKKCECDYFLKDLGPDEVLSYLYHADFVLSASFHATLFSIMNNKHFVSLLPDKHTNDRIEDVLDWTHLKDRIIKSELDLDETIFGKIDYDKVDKEVKKRVEYSRDWLDQTLNELKDKLASL